MDFEFPQGLMVTDEVPAVVPSHCVDVSLNDFLCKLWLPLCEKRKKRLLFEEILVLENLRIDVGGPKRADAGREIVFNPFCSLEGVSH